MVEERKEEKSQDTLADFTECTPRLKELRVYLDGELRKVKEVVDKDDVRLDTQIAVWNAFEKNTSDPIWLQFVKLHKYMYRNEKALNALVYDDTKSSFDLSYRIAAIFQLFAEDIDKRLEGIMTKEEGQELVKKSVKNLYTLIKKQENQALSRWIKDKFDDSTNSPPPPPKW